MKYTQKKAKKVSFSDKVLEKVRKIQDETLKKFDYFKIYFFKAIDFFDDIFKSSSAVTVKNEKN